MEETAGATVRTEIRTVEECMAASRSVLRLCCLGRDEYRNCVEVIEQRE